MAEPWVNDFVDARNALQTVVVDILRADVAHEDDSLPIVADLETVIPVHDRLWWLLAGRVLVTRAIGVAEAWLDAPGLGEDVRLHIHQALYFALTEAIASEITPEGFIELYRGLRDRNIDWTEIAIPRVFLVS